MLYEELSMDCPFCSGKVKVRHRTSITIRKRSITATLGSRYNLQTSKEIYEVLEDCPKYNKTNQ